MEISKELSDETRKLVKQWENIPITHPSGSIITESFGVVVLEDGTRIVFKSDKEREGFFKSYEYTKKTEKKTE